jgi:hypothetical protein
MLDGNKEKLLEETFEEVIEETGQWTQEEAMYVVVPEIEHDCQKCCFYNPAGSCELVEGSIAAEGHCRFWVQPCSEDEIESYSMSQSIADLDADEDFLYILALMQDENLANYKFDTLLENLASDLLTEVQELSASKVSLVKKDKNQSGGLNASGRAKYNAQGSNLKAPVDKKPTTLEQIRRQGSFLTRMYNRDKIPPLKKPDGKPTRYALQSSVWNSPIPKTIADVRRLAAKGKALLARYEKLKEKAKSKKTKQKLSQSDPIEELPICLSNGMVKIPIAKKGSWFHDVHGLVSFTDNDFTEIKRESSKEVLGFTPYITYGHPTNLPYESVDAELKKGDLTGWEEKDDVLFGLFDAKEDVVSLINNKDYEYSSGEFLRNYKDKFTGQNKGTVLMRVALTNSPFIPFGDTKVEALSTNANSTQDCLPKPISYVIKLSTDIQENINTPIKEDLPEINMSEVKTPDQLATEVVEKLIPEIKEVKPEVSVAPVEVKETVPVQTAPVIDFNALLEKFTAQALENTKIAVNAVKAESEAVISGLKSQLETVTNQLTETREVTQAFSTSLTNQARAQEQRELLGNGVKPTLIQKFSQIQSAIETKQTVVKLSTQAANGQVVESEQSVINLIKELLVDAVNSEPVNLQQFGQSATKVPAYGLQGAINNKVEENRAKASKVSL